MVHALQSAKKILAPDGILINVHDLPVPHVIELQADGKTTRAGWLFAEGDFKIERAAYAAITQVVLDSQFILVDEQDFDFRAYTDGLKEFQDWLAESWDTSIIPDQTLRRIEEISREALSPVKIILKSPARMTKLRMV